MVGASEVGVAVEAFITGDVLRWARERANLSPEAVAKGLKVPTSVYSEWEDGTRRPSFSKAQDVAGRLRIPFGYLFLSHRPTDRLELPDLRTPDDETPQEPSIDLLDVVEDALRKQSWYREYRLEQGEEPLPFVGRFGVNTNYRVIAADIRETLGLTIEFHRDSDSWEDFLRRAIRQTERIGILVFRTGIVGSNTHRSLDREEFKGFVISDDVAPAIFINSKDWKTSQIFTLAHELAHIWIGQSGVSNPDLGRPPSEQAHPIEKFCNRIAAEILVPEEDLRPRWDGAASVKENVTRLASWFRVSQISLLRQARDVGLVSSAEFSADFERQSDERRARTEKADDDGNDGGNFYNTLFARSSPTFTSALLDAVVAGHVSPVDAASLLGVKRNTLDRIAAKMGVVADA